MLEIKPIHIFIIVVVYIIYNELSKNKKEHITNVPLNKNGLTAEEYRSIKNLGVLANKINSGDSIAINGDLSIGGKLSVNGDLGVTGKSTFENDCSITGNHTMTADKYKTNTSGYQYVASHSLWRIKIDENGNVNKNEWKNLGGTADIRGIYTDQEYVYVTDGDGGTYRVKHSASDENGWNSSDYKLYGGSDRHRRFVAVQRWINSS